MFPHLQTERNVLKLNNVYVNLLHCHKIGGERIVRMSVVISKNLGNMRVEILLPLSNISRVM
jgi:hypothetical protein